MSPEISGPAELHDATSPTGDGWPDDAEDERDPDWPDDWPDGGDDPPWRRAAIPAAYGRYG
ncbi:MAG: hypothetical protein WB800_29760, partial [Streptosporangiaceae bacterium]